MPFRTSDDRETTVLQVGDQIVFTPENSLLRISREGLRVLPGLSGDADNKCILGFIRTPHDFMDLCRLMAHSAGLGIPYSLPYESKGMWTYTVIAPTE